MIGRHNVGGGKKEVGNKITYVISSGMFSLRSFTYFVNVKTASLSYTKTYLFSHTYSNSQIDIFHGQNNFILQRDGKGRKHGPPLWTFVL